MSDNKLSHNSKVIHGWELSNEPYDQGKILELREKINDHFYKQINSIIVVKNGKLLIEEYFNGATRDQPHDPRSVGKTFASAITGIALRDGYIKSVDQTLDEFYDLEAYGNFHEMKSQVSLKHLLTMSSAFDGYDFDQNSIGNEENMYPQDNWVKWALSLPMMESSKPGDKWHYFTAGIVILGDILHKSVPGGLENYADEKLFKPLGIRNYFWQYTPQHVANTAGGIRLTPRDFAKFGYLYKNKGQWENKQIIPKNWIVESFTPHYQTTLSGNQYGYLWWKTNYCDNQAYETYYCGGNGGNKIFVFTKYDLVIVITASAYGQRYAHSQVDEMMEKYILLASYL